ncbi:MAG: MaoC family dehydratase N-terminal domain-containing protein [Pseudomonadota bacterium]
MAVQNTTAQPSASGSGTAAFDAFLEQRLGPYQAFNPVSRTQIWQWCSVMGERSPLYLDAEYQRDTEFSGRGAVAPPAMLQMWTMRDINDAHAPGSTDAHPYPHMQTLEAAGFLDNVAVGYDLHFHRYLTEGETVQHYKSVASISSLKQTQLGEGHFFTDKMEYLDGGGKCFAEAFITYFQYRPIEGAMAADAEQSSAAGAVEPKEDSWVPDYQDLDVSVLTPGVSLPTLAIPITHRLLVGGAIATQDFTPVHHDVPAARAAGMADIFMNILTSCGLSARYLGDWAGPGSRLQRLSFKLMTPNFPGDVMRFQGRVSALERLDQGASIGLEFAGLNAAGPHISGSAQLWLPGK